jgi:hypothetical protein
LKNDKNVASKQKVISKNTFKKLFLVAILKVTEKAGSGAYGSADPDPYAKCHGSATLGWTTE